MNVETPNVTLDFKKDFSNLIQEQIKIFEDKGFRFTSFAEWKKNRNDKKTSKKDTPVGLLDRSAPTVDFSDDETRQKLLKNGINS